MLSFVTPTVDFKTLGASAFVAVPIVIGTQFADGEASSDWPKCILNASLILGWLANFTVFFSLPRGVATGAAAAPWILFFAMIFLSHTKGPDFKILSFIPFYPWAIGIALIHLSGMTERGGNWTAGNLNAPNRTST